VTLDECDALFAMVRCTTVAVDLARHFEKLLGADYPVIRVGITRGSIFWRGRACGAEGYSNVREVTYPPAHLAGLNRLSDKKQPRFYASARRETALAEQAECNAGQHFHLLGSWLMAGHEIRALVLGELHHVYKLGYWRTFGVDPGNTLSRQLNALPRDRATRAIYIDAFLGSILSDPLARESGYVRSRALLSTIANRYPVDAVFFPSVMDPWGTNIVITPEAVDGQMVHCVSQVVHVDRVREFGFLETTLRRQAKGIDQSGDFEWQEDTDPGREVIFGMTKEEYEFALRNAASPNGLLDLKAFQSL
jgi:RES domain